jgi:PleD family two-component response regulator
MAAVSTFPPALEFSGIRPRRNDVVGHYGGEEFLLVLPNCNKEEA